MTGHMLLLSDGHAVREATPKSFYDIRRGGAEKALAAA